MAWTGGTTRTTGQVVTAAMWNNHMGVGGDLDILFDGTRVNADLVYELSLACGNVPRNNKLLVARDGDTGGLRWLSPHQNPLFISRVF